VRTSDVGCHVDGLKRGAHGRVVPDGAAPRRHGDCGSRVFNIGVAKTPENGKMLPGTGGRAQHSPAHHALAWGSATGSAQRFRSRQGHPIRDERWRQGVGMVWPQRIFADSPAPSSPWPMSRNRMRAGHEAPIHSDRRTDAGARSHIPTPRTARRAACRRPQHGADILGRDVDARG